MAPTLQAGTLLLVRTKRRYAVGDIVVFTLNGTEMVKRITGAKDGRFTVRGDNQHDSFDSRAFGGIPAGSIKGCVMLRLSRAINAGPLRPTL
ncbi:S26 family signal peptidase [Candidatus Saccharibacteria bacterium]|nr:S26 family signal peptidase [Candidatus Saccharibacteria bacterium]